MNWREYFREMAQDDPVLLGAITLVVIVCSPLLIVVGLLWALGKLIGRILR